MRLRSIPMLLLALASLSAAHGQTQESFAGTVPIVGSVHGNFGSNFKTSVQLTNPFETGMTGRLEFTPMGVATEPVSMPFALDGHETLAFDDVVAAMGQTGLGSLDVWFHGPPKDFCGLKPYAGGPVVSARIYNDAGDAGTSGCNENLVTTLPGGGNLVVVRGALAGPPSVDRYRFNIGLRVFEEVGSPTAPIQITVYDAQGTIVHTLTREFPASYFAQMDVTEFLDGFEIGDNSSIGFQTLARIVVYGATVDNVTNSPTIQIMAYVNVSG